MSVKCSACQKEITFNRRFEPDNAVNRKDSLLCPACRILRQSSDKTGAETLPPDVAARLFPQVETSREAYQRYMRMFLQA